ncbi:MAG: hypothetical protein FWC76_01290 [Defluviitaleaceae bacterium]|nr:hypothetical protein [Defluviitaleaceae bacterium]
MYDKDKIRIMSKLAVYDKNDFERDSKSSQYFRHDYIYKHNMRMRFFLGIGCVILLFFYVMHLLGEGVDIFTLDFEVEIMRLLFYALIIMFAYSFIGTIIYTREFIISERRINAYFALMRQLDGQAEGKDIEDMQSKPKPKIRKKKVKVEEPEEDDFEEHVPYRRYERATLEYRRRGTLNNEIEEDDDDK